MNLLLNGDLIFEICMIVMKGYLIDIEDPDDKNFRKKNNNDLKFLFWLCPNLAEHRKIFFVDLTYKNFDLKIYRIELIWELRFNSYWF